MSSRVDSPESGRGNLAQARFPRLNAPDGGFQHPAGFNSDRRTSITDLSQYTSTASLPVPPPAVVPGPTAGYAFGASFGPGVQQQSTAYSNPAASNYPPNNQQAASFYDYSIRRHSLTGAGGNPNSPPRLPSLDSPTVDNPVLKRKPSNEEESIDSYRYPLQGNYAPPSNNGLSYPKRRGSSLAYDKVNLSDQMGRRESMINGGALPNSWEEERRSAQMYGGMPSGSGMDNRAYGGGYAMPGPDYGQARQIPSFPPQHSHPPPQRQHLPDSYDNSAPRMLDQEYAARRPNSSNGLPPPPPITLYANPPSNPLYTSQNRAPPLYAIPAPPPPEPRRSAPLQSNSAPSTSSARFNGGYANLPPASGAWARAGPLPPVVKSRPNPVSLKDQTPYSRSPELRVSHKLAERKRRKEMATLFDNLRDALPVDRGLKSSKWEILTKAVEYIALVKEYNADLAQDSTVLRNHFDLGPGPQPPAALGIVSPPLSQPPTPAPPQTDGPKPRPPDRTRSGNSSASMTRNSSTGTARRKSSEEDYEEEDDEEDD